MKIKQKMHFIVKFCIICFLTTSLISFTLNSSISADALPHRSNQSEQVIKIGVMLPLNNNQDSNVFNVLDGILTAGVEINASEEFSFDVEFVVKNEGISEVEQIKAYNELKSQGVQIIIGPMFSQTAYNIAPLATEDKIVLISPTANSMNLNLPYPVNSSHDYFFRVISSDLFGVRALANLIFSLNYRNLIVLYDTKSGAGPGTISLKERHIQEFTDIGGTIIEEIEYESVIPIDKIIELSNATESVGLTVITGKPSDVLDIYSELRIQGIETPIFVGDMRDAFLTNPNFNNSYLNNIYGVSPSNISPYGPIYNNFIQQLGICNALELCSQGTEPTSYEGYSYDAVHVASIATRIAGEYFGEKIKLSMFEAGKQYLGVTGNKTFLSLGDPEENRNEFWMFENNTASIVGNWSVWQGTYLYPKDSKTVPDLIDLVLQFFSFIFFSIIAMILLFILMKKKRNSVFTEYFESFEVENLRKLYHKVIIGIEKAVLHLNGSNLASTSLIESENEYYLEKTENSNDIVVTNIFPPDIFKDVKSKLKGRTIIVLIELAFQDQENSNSTYIGNILDISAPTIFKDIRKLLELKLIRPFHSEVTLKDSRTKFYSITYDGYLFLNLLKESLSITLMKYKRVKKQTFE